MITALVRMELPEATTPAEAAHAWRAPAEALRGTPGLIRKYYALSDDGRTTYGIYLWETRAAAESAFSEEWARDRVERLGMSRPEVTILECPVVLDNTSGEIVVAEPDP